MPFHYTILPHSNDKCSSQIAKNHRIDFDNVSIGPIGVGSISNRYRYALFSFMEDKVLILFHMINIIAVDDWCPDSKWKWWRHQIEPFSALLARCVGNSPVTGEIPLKGQWRGALMFSLICKWINDWVNNREAGDLRCHRANYDVTVMNVVAMECHCGDNTVIRPPQWGSLFWSIYHPLAHYVTSAPFY